jgi:hypothetical protein
VYRAFEQALVREFSRNNKALLAILLVLEVMIQPIVLIFGPIPAYFLYTSPIYSWPFWLALTFFLLLSWVSLKLYDAVVDVRRTRSVVLVAGKFHFLRGYCWGQLRFALPTILLLLLGLFRVENTVFHYQRRA